MWGKSVKVPRAKDIQIESLKIELQASRNERDNLRARVRDLERSLCSPKPTPSRFGVINFAPSTVTTRIQFKCVHPEHLDLFDTVFILGLGPCGKVVSKLSMSRDEKFLTIKQTHADGTSKDFIYKLEDIIGRITEEKDNAAR